MCPMCAANVHISSLPELLDEGMQVKDFDGTPMDPFVLLQDDA